jgi:elongation factor 1 alpha-like protein
MVQKQKALTSTALPIVNRTDKNQKEVGCRFLGQQEALSDTTSQGTAGDHEQRNPSNLRKVFPLEEYKPESWILLEEKEPYKSLLHLAIVGHVDAGKSTMMGRLLHLMGRVSEKEMRKYEREAKQKGKGSFAYAWVLDESVEERERGLTMTVAVAHFELPNLKVVLLDSPGHKDFVPNMISGASQADAAVLVIDASIGAFEAGMYGQGEGQTKEHAQLIRSFGVEQLIIAVNKMDTVDNSKGRFSFIKSQLGPFLRRCGFKESSMIWIPLSALENQNLTSATSDARLNSWYSGPYLLEAMDHLQPPKRDISRPLRLPISEVTKSRSLGQVAISGKLEGGAVKIGTKVLVMPAGVVATVKAIEQDAQVCAVARAGDNVDIALQGIDISFLMIGGVLCHPDYPVPIATHIELKVVILDITMPILVGSQVELHIHHVREAAKVVQLLSILDPKTGLVRKKTPRCLTANQNALMEVVPDRGACIEEYTNYRALGRVTLRAAGRTIAVGIVNRIIEQQ